MNIWFVFRMRMESVFFFSKFTNEFSLVANILFASLAGLGVYNIVLGIICTELWMFFIFFYSCCSLFNYIDFPNIQEISLCFRDFWKWYLTQTFAIRFSSFFLHFFISFSAYFSCWFFYFFLSLLLFLSGTVTQQIFSADYKINKIETNENEYWISFVSCCIFVGKVNS